MKRSSCEAEMRAILEKFLIAARHFASTGEMTKRYESSQNGTKQQQGAMQCKTSDCSGRNNDEKKRQTQVGNIGHLHAPTHLK